MVTNKICKVIMAEISAGSSIVKQCYYNAIPFVHNALIPTKFIEHNATIILNRVTGQVSKV